ncbi:hypothetical protein [Nocardia brasiliensis]|uniref:hypothetical protein n=1 Tax=Nocardia brasiliensis TaxID=37326 RepID=UPI0024540A6B|nr:hypothetical protein [Nocardia brasiliensis]
MKSDPFDRSETGLDLDHVPYGTLPPGPDPAADREIDRLLWESTRANYENVMGRGGPDGVARAVDLLEQARMHWVVSGRPDERNHDGVHVLQVIVLLRFAIVIQRRERGEPMFPELEDFTS